MFTVCCKGVVILYTLSIDDKLGVFVLNHLPAHKLIFYANFQAVQRYGINDSYVFVWLNLFLAVLVRSCGMDFDDTLCNENGLSLVADVLMFGNLFRIVPVGYVIEFLKGY